MEAFRMPPASPFSPDLRSPRSVRNSMMASSKFTKPQPSRHPLSHSALNHSLQNTLAARRHACSHLLALRFGDDEDDGYWEDVRSVMGLLSSALDLVMLGVIPVIALAVAVDTLFKLLLSGIQRQ